MPGIDAVLLARIQFAFTMGFHIVFPAFTIGLASFLVVLEGLWLKTGRQVYLDLFRYWVKIFAIGFGMGVVSGLPMEYQFGTNWGALSDRAGSILGPLLGYEVLMAFFLEAGFLGIMLFGMDRVGRGLHFMATCLVALGTFFSAFWILSANSWMQTPQGYTIAADGRFLPASWLEIVFNPSFPYRLVHMVLATFISVAFMVGAVGAVHLLRNNRNEAARTMFSMAMWMVALVTPIQIVAGDMHGLNTLQHQPAKVAAMEGAWETASPDTGEAMILFGVPDMQAATNHYEIALPRLGSLILTHSWDGVIQGLKTFPPENRPFVPLVFFAFRIMVALGFLMFAVGLLSLYLRWKQRLYASRLFLRLASGMGTAWRLGVRVPRR